ncbi:hypothetical protein [Leifsonia poae]|uniref:hypothetical protein n=1 Tax=Leifsonia poae TaxID=110933 RepID=UPI003D6668D9
MKPYGLPLDDLEGIEEWDDLATDENARRMGDAIQERLGRGDTAANLSSTSLVTNAWLYDHDHEFAAWVLEYVAAWRERAESNGGLIPDNVGPSGAVGELHDGRWYGGHYGWAWPHGLPTVETGALVAVINESIITGRTDQLDLARAPLDTVIAEGIVTTGAEAAKKMGWGWVQKVGLEEDAPIQLVPYRHNTSGWFDFNPVQLSFPVWLWWLSNEASDLHRLESIEAESGFDWRATRWFHDKEEQGHEAPWVSYLLGRNPGYPEDALEMALGQVTRRLAMMRATPYGPSDDDIHWWQRLNPVATEVLTQLTTGAPPALYNGGLSVARVVFGDAAAARPGLPADVAALVSEVDAHGVRLELVNLSEHQPREVIVQAGGFGEDRIDAVTYDELIDGYPGSARDYLIPQPSLGSTTLTASTSRITVVLPPLSAIGMRLDITRRAYAPAHRSFSRPNTWSTY